MTPVVAILSFTALLYGGQVSAQSMRSVGLTRQQQISKLQLEERILQLELRERALATQLAELETTRDLYERGFVTLLTYKQTRNSYEEARLNKEEAEILLEETKLNLLKTATHIVVRNARKYKTKDGKGMIEVVLENASDLEDALIVDPTLSEDDLRTLLKVENIYVSLRNGPIVSEPYEIRVPALEVGEQRSLTYRLLRDEEAIVVVLNYLDIVDESIPVILRKGGRQELPSINSAQFSQTGDLQQDVRFDLIVERLSDEERSFALAVVGLPQKIESSFISSGAKVSQVKFDESTSRDTLALELEIPEKLDRRFIGRTRTFFALVMEASEYPHIHKLRAKYVDDPVPEKDVKALRCNYVKLELIPKGIGKLEVLVANRYQEIEFGEELRIRVEFHNRGSVFVQNIKAALDVPYQWEHDAEPNLIKRLEPDERVPITITARPPDDIAVGKYDLGIEAQGQVGNENVESLEKNLTIHVGARANITGNAILIGILVFLVVGIGVASMKISRR
ncbi:MAG: NEW3 domain-containing protein [Candidatus Latescibacterota bacterium]|nr:NEW3 domain-containing protein [Candidatus Latescibacterota bacterium]